MKHISLRNVSPRLERALRDEQRRRSASLNRTVLDLLEQALGCQAEKEFDNGLGREAGGWDANAIAAFDEHTAIFEQVDQELWREGP